MATGAWKWAWKNSRAANSALIVLLAIADEADHDGKAAMSVLELSQKCRLGERTVQASVRELVRLGELRVWPKSGEHARNGYEVITVRGAGSAPLTPAGYAPRHVRRGAGSAGVQNLRGADPAPHKPDTSQVTPPRGAGSAPLENADVLTSSTGKTEVQAKDVSEVAARPDVDRLCDHLADRIEANGSKRPAITKRWRDAARLLIDRDGRTEQQVTAAIDWCQKDEFWRANILSMPKLREKYDQLRLQASRNGTPRTRQADTDALFDRQMARAKARDSSEQPGNRNPLPVHPRALPGAGHG